VKETIEESAGVIWSMARDLAMPRESGTSLNCERNIRYITSVLSAYAVKHAGSSIIVMEAVKTAGYAEQLKQAMADIKTLKAQLSKKEGTACVGSE